MKNDGLGGGAASMTTVPAEDTFRGISIDGYAGVTRPAEFGAAPMLDWLEIARLVIDGSYQRDIKKDGRTSIRKIAENFRWSRFAPVIVAPIAGGRFAIIDGQHRTTAAALVGHDKVPCQVITADRREQAASFAAVNGVVTRIHPLSIFKASIAAGNQASMRVVAVAKRAGVKLLMHPVTLLDQKPGETMCVVGISRAIEQYGEDLVVLALRCVVETQNRVVGGLPSSVVRAMPEAVSTHIARGRSEALILQAFGRINIIRELGKAQMVERLPGQSFANVLRDRLILAVSNVAPL